MFHRSERLSLRPVFSEDWEAIHAGLSDFGVVSMLASAPWPYGQEDAIAFTRLPQDPLRPNFLMTLPGAQGAPVIGSIGFGGEGDQAELGYWVARGHWGQGYATEAGRAVLKIARMLGHKRVQAGHAVDNPASGRVLTKIGFRPTGEIRPQFSKGRGDLMLVRRMAIDLVESECDVGSRELQAA